MNIVIEFEDKWQRRITVRPKHRLEYWIYKAQIYYLFKIKKVIKWAKIHRNQPLPQNVKS